MQVDADETGAALVQEGSGAPLHVGTAHHGHGEDAFSAVAKRVQHQEHASRWGEHMAGRMSRPPSLKATPQVCCRDLKYTQSWSKRF